MFDLTGFENLKDDDILNTSITESSEFVNDGNATNNVDTGTPDATVSIPGGDKETPTAKPEGGEQSVPIPGGDKEAPNSKPHDAASISIPSKATLTEEERNEYLKQVQRSFQEGIEVINMITEATIVSKTIEDKQIDFMESAIDEAVLNSLDNGPVFEAVDRSDKNDVKKIVTALRKKMPEEFKENGMKFYTVKIMASVIKNVIFGAVGGAVTNAITGGIAGGVGTFFTKRFWQILGLCYMESGNIKDLVDRLNEKYKEELGEYKILQSKAGMGIVSLFRVKFNWKNEKRAWILLIDKKLPDELKELNKEIDDAVKNSKDSSDNSKDDKKDK